MEVQILFLFLTFKHILQLLVGTIMVIVPKEKFNQQMIA